MKIVITRDAGTMSVDNDSRPVDTSLLPPGVEAVVWDSVKETGWLQYDESQTIEAQDRDLEAERVENERRRENNLLPLEEPIYRTIEVQRPPNPITDFGPFQVMYDQWAVYETPAQPTIPPEMLEEMEALRQDREAAADEQPVASSPVTFRDLRQMTRAEARAWYDANITTNAQISRVVRWLFLYIVRRM